MLLSAILKLVDAEGLWWVFVEYHDKFEPDMSYTQATSFQTISLHSQMAPIFFPFFSFLKQGTPMEESPVIKLGLTCRTQMSFKLKE